ncbi:MAG: B12-binding domain-containing radical SAM protein [Gammaproteobacteria bacterium]|nr:B12-binding domain-containing radical SAM protein [Gammaproteobacteria bacterium]
MRLLLINPRFPESFWSFRWALRKIVPGKRAINPPLGLATLAALCPAHWQVVIVDENVEPVPLEPEADIVGVGAMGVQFQRQRELLDFYRRHGYYTVAGGSYASLCPERYAGLARTVISGEAERIWPEFCRDFDAGAFKSLYCEKGMVDLERSPVPRYDLLRLELYTSASVQFSRGCPYRCEFCDIIVMFGRRPRSKRPEQIGAELDALRRRGIRRVFFVDDNLIGNRKIAKELLRHLIAYQRLHKYAFRFGAQLSVNLAGDAELIELLRAANFSWVFIGIESPDEESLEETRKTQNMRADLLSSVRVIQAHGIDVLAGFIVGFDHDSVSTFDRQYRFITSSGIVIAMVGLLTALPKTPLHRRLEQEGRLIREAGHGDNTKSGTNFVPRLMSYEDMVAGYRDLCRRLFSDAGLSRRIRNKARYLKGAGFQGVYSAGESAAILLRLVLRGLLPGGPLRVCRFVRTLAVAPKAWPQVFEDWITGLAVLDYVKRHFPADPRRDGRLVRETADAIRRLCARRMREGRLEILTRLEESRTSLLVLLGGNVDAAFYSAAARRMERLLRRSAATVTLCIDELSRDQEQALGRLLQRLAPWGDRVSIWISEHLRLSLPVDSSVFHLLLGDNPMIPARPL